MDLQSRFPEGGKRRPSSTPPCKFVGGLHERDDRPSRRFLLSLFNLSSLSLSLTSFSFSLAHFFHSFFSITKNALTNTFALPHTPRSFITAAIIDSADVHIFNSSPHSQTSSHPQWELWISSLARYRSAPGPPF